MRKLLQYCFFSLLLFSPFFAKAQFNEQTERYFFDERFRNISYIDSGILNNEEYNFLQDGGWEYLNLGNIGLAHRPLTLIADTTHGFDAGFHAFDRYKKAPNRIPYYDLKRPLSEIWYDLGSKRENVFGASHAQNVKNVFSYGFNFDRIRSEGLYDAQRTRNAAFDLYGIFNSKNGRYQLEFDLTFSKIKAEENGGISVDILNDTVGVPIDPSLYPTFLSAALTEHKNMAFTVENSYHFGEKIIRQINDSLSTTELISTFSLFHGIGTSKNTHSFQDDQPIPSFYGDFYQIDDSLFYRMYHHNIPHYLGLRYSGAKVEGDSLRYMNLAGELRLQHNNIEIWQNSVERTYNNFHLAFALHSPVQLNTPFRYYADGAIYFTGYNRGDLSFKGGVSYDFDKYGIVSSELGFLREEPSFIENNFFSVSENWQNGFGKQDQLRLKLNYSIPRFRTGITLEYRNLQNYVYFDALGPQQNSGNIAFWSVGAQNKFRRGIFNWNNFIALQGVSNSDIIRLPSFFWRSSVYLEGKIFKGNMLASFGIDMRWFGDHRADAWNPLFGQFVIQDERMMRYVPVFDVFINFKVQSLRVFVKSNYVTQGLFQDNIYNALNYPDRGRFFTGGLKWRFFE